MLTTFMNGSLVCVEQLFVSNVSIDRNIYNICGIVIKTLEKHKTCQPFLQFFERVFLNTYC